MKRLPNLEDTLLVRTDFSDDFLWNKICEEINNPEAEYNAYVEFINDKEFDNLSSEEIILRLPKNFEHVILLIADSDTFKNSEHTILCIDLYDEIGKKFRVIISELWSVENNLSIANMDFCDFFNATDNDNIFRGFK